MALAIYGFLPRQRRTEEAGIMYETRLVREKIEKGVDPSPVYTGTLIIEDLSNASDAACDQDTPDNHFDPDDDNYLRFVRSLDPKDTKSQDHYKVLGLSQLRWKATRNQIKTAYRQKSLKHHPDKRQNVGADDYFVCITNAYNQLYLKEEDRRAYDSMDPTFDESVPRPSEVNAKNFYKVLHSVFEMNSRFSRKKNIPKLGDADASREHVEEFYDFWFAFDSWRDFSYADEEDKERGEDRWERRQIEKQNKVEREKKRKEEVKRIRGLVEMAYSADPRIQKFKDEDREKKQQEKEAKRLLIQKKKEEERLAQEEEERKRRQQEELGKQKLAEEKKQKDRAKKVLQQARRSFRQTVEAAKYWADCHEKQMRCMEEVERICLAADKETLDDLASKLSAVKIYDEAFTLMNDACKKESENVLSAASDAQSSAVKVVNWTIEENQLLIKATNVFPAGTVDRWNQIAAYINEHCSDKTQKPKTDRDVIKQTKAVQKMEFKPLTNQNKLGTGVVLNNGTAAEAAKAEDVWSTAQQKLLEEGLKKFPTSDAERWDKIAALVEGKNKKDCMRRYKKLVQMIKDKKGAS